MLLSSGVLAGSCRKNTKAEVSNPVAQPLVGAKKYLALGDSYTIGQNVSSTDRYPYLTVVALRSLGVNISDPEYIATTGWTTANLQNAIKLQNVLGTYDAVSLLIGVNDQYQGVDTATYRVRFTQLLMKAVELAGNKKERVFVLSIPDYSATPYVAANDKQRVSNEIDGFNAINRQVTLQNNISYINITPLTRQAAHDGSLLANDGLHYSGKEYQEWANLLAPAMQMVLQ